MVNYIIEIAQYLCFPLTASNETTHMSGWLSHPETASHLAVTSVTAAEAAVAKEVSPKGNNRTLYC